MQPIYLIRAVFFPTLAIIPMYAAFMSVTQRIENGSWKPGPFQKMIRAMAFVYSLCVMLQVLYGGVVYLIWHRLGFQSFGSWICFYLAVPLALAIFRSNTRSGLQDASVHIAFAAVIAALTWPFLAPTFGPS
jgi:hypothetical protein